MNFAKYHGIGNDFIVVDLREVSSEVASKWYQASIRLCDRRFGVGADGVLMVLPPDSQEAEAKMLVVNSDGSEAQMCGNGIRCVAKYLMDSAGNKPESVVIDAGAGPLRSFAEYQDGELVSVRVDMGAASTEPSKLPIKQNQPLVSGALEDIPDLEFTAISVGNPHAIAFIEGQHSLRQLAETYGEAVENHPLFPERTNAEFAQIISPERIHLVVWERGCGVTLACGTGACATAAAACLTNRTQPNTDITVSLLGGDLVIRVEEDLKRIWMSGPAKLVFKGELDIEKFLPVEGNPMAEVLSQLASK